MSTKKKGGSIPKQFAEKPQTKKQFLICNMAIPGVNGGVSISGEVTPDIEKAVKEHCDKYRLDIGTFKSRYYSDVDFKVIKAKRLEEKRKAKLGFK